MKQHLLDHYSPSTFNTCEHQLLPMMEGPAMRLMIDPKATPTAYHSPISVPLHWQDDVKAGLDRDVRLGVIEPVPIGEPVTWCHRMVICAKKNGKPRRTIDFQALNITQPGRPTIPNHHSTRPGLSHTAKRRRFLTRGMDITVSHFIPRTGTLPPSSHPGAGTDIVQPLRVTSPLETGTLGGLTKLHPLSQTKPNA